MATTRHDDIELTAGDDWVIPGTLLDPNGGPLDLTSASFEWTLVDPNGIGLADLVNASTIDVSDPVSNGKIQITVPRNSTEPLLAGRYHDSLRVIISNEVESYWIGTILVDCDPFSL
jgi:hypothetical protein